jgi:hypothetical protein
VEYFFEWDPHKARTNLAKHGISFERGTTVFRDPRALNLFDREHSGPEDRWITLGADESGQVLVVCHTFGDESARSCSIRVFPVRTATRRERSQYEG